MCDNFGSCPSVTCALAGLTAVAPFGTSHCDFSFRKQQAPQSRRWSREGTDPPRRQHHPGWQQELGRPEDCLLPLGENPVRVSVACRDPERANPKGHTSPQFCQNIPNIHLVCAVLKHNAISWGRGKYWQMAFIFAVFEVLPCCNSQPFLICSLIFLN